jgi:hypothetical protein
MSKAHRGKGIKDLIGHGKAVCPLCNRMVKVIYEEKTINNPIKICKICKATIKHGKKKLA